MSSHNRAQRVEKNWSFESKNYFHTPYIVAFYFRHVVQYISSYCVHYQIFPRADKNQSADCVRRELRSVTLATDIVSNDVRNFSFGEKLRKKKKKNKNKRKRKYPAQLNVKAERRDANDEIRRQIRRLWTLITETTS